MISALCHKTYVTIMNLAARIERARHSCSSLAFLPTAPLCIRQNSSFSASVMICAFGSDPCFLGMLSLLGLYKKCTL